MMDRRGATVIFGMAAFVGMGWLVARRLRFAQPAEAHTSPTVFESEPVNAFDERLRADLARLKTRVYSEEGIPMFLVCENLALKTASQASAAAPSPTVNKTLASAFRRYADAWQRIRPDAPASDVAKLVEALADRDFANGGDGKSL